MGIIIKESFNQTAIRIGISMLSALAVIFLYPKNRELYGLINYVLNTAALLMPFILLGLTQSVIRFFPYSGNNKRSRKNFAKFIAIIFSVSIAVFFVFFYFFKKTLLALEENPSPDLEYYLKYVAIGAILFSTVEILVRYLSNYKIVAIPVAFQNLYKIATPIAFGLIFLGIIDKEFGIQLILFVLFISILSLLVMSFKRIFAKDDDTNNDNDKNQLKTYSKKEFYVYYFWGFCKHCWESCGFENRWINVNGIDRFYYEWGLLYCHVYNNGHYYTWKCRA